MVGVLALPRHPVAVESVHGHTRSSVDLPGIDCPARIQ